MKKVFLFIIVMMFNATVSNAAFLAPIDPETCSISYIEGYPSDGVAHEDRITFDFYLEDGNGVFDGYHFTAYWWGIAITKYWYLTSGDARPDYEGYFILDDSSTITLQLYVWVGNKETFQPDIITLDDYTYNPVTGDMQLNEGYLFYNQVPVPGAVWLLGPGLIGLVGIRWKFRKR